METFLIALLKVIETRQEEEKFLQVVLQKDVYTLYHQCCDIILKTNRGQFPIASVLRSDLAIDIEKLSDMNKLLMSSYGTTIRKHLEKPWNGLHNEYLLSVFTSAQYKRIQRFVMVYYYIKMGIKRTRIEYILGIQLGTNFFSEVYQKAARDPECFLDELILRVEEQGLWKEEEQ